METRANHILDQFARSERCSESRFNYKGVEVVMAGEPCGDDFFAVLYPERSEAIKVCRDYAVHNNRRVKGSSEQNPYPYHIYGDVLAIEATLQKSPDEPKLDRAAIFAIYDREPPLFMLLRTHALKALGILEDVKLNSGKEAWATMLELAGEFERLLKIPNTQPSTLECKQFVISVKRNAKLALKDYDVEVEEDEDDDLPEEPLLEHALGNSEAGKLPEQN